MRQGDGQRRHKPGEAIGTLTVLLGAGGESTASLIGNAVRMLADDSGLQEQIRSDHGLIENFIEEAVRLESPFRGHYRQVKRDCELGGVSLSAGTTAFLLWSSANRDPAEHDRPDEVVLNRRLPRSPLGFRPGHPPLRGRALSPAGDILFAQAASGGDQLVLPSCRRSAPVGEEHVRPPPRTPALDVVWN